MNAFHLVCFSHIYYSFIKTKYYYVIYIYYKLFSFYFKIYWYSGVMLIVSYSANISNV